LKTESLWENGIQFQCQGSGNCCVSRGGYGYVYMTLEDRRLMAKVLGLQTQVFTKKYCDKKAGVWKLATPAEGDCMFLKDKRCTVYKGRPTQCRTWPFWPEVLNAKTWKGEVAAFCPGVGKGKVWSKEEVEAKLKEQRRSESQYGD
jgi:Fe-S-cluster containining protein